MYDLPARDVSTISFCHQILSGNVQTTPIRLDRRDSLRDISCGENFTVALTEDGQILYFGKSLFDDKLYWGPKKIASDVRFTSLSAGVRHCAAISEDGMVYTWGTQGGWFQTGGYLGISGATELLKPTYAVFNALIF